MRVVRDGARHSGAKDSACCLLTNALNPILDRAAFWRWMEAILRAATGIAPSGEPKGHGPVPQG